MADPDASSGAALRRMLEPRSIAVVGASVKQGSLGASMMRELRRGGFEGAVYPVNPGYDEVDGYRCYPSILEVPEPVDLAILGVANARVEQALTDAAALGARSAVTFSSLYEEAGDGPDLRARLKAIAVEHGMPMCGGNGMGFVNVGSKTRAVGFETPDELRAGPVTFISHSGSAFSALSFVGLDADEARTVPLLDSQSHSWIELAAAPENLTWSVFCRQQSGAHEGSALPTSSGASTA